MFKTCSNVLISQVQSTIVLRIGILYRSPKRNEIVKVRAFFSCFSEKFFFFKNVYHVLFEKSNFLLKIYSLL